MSDIEILYVGEKGGMEEGLCKKYDIPFHGISAGKLRRYFSFQNILDIFKIFIGFFQAFFILMSFRPNVVFSKGGYVAFPVVFASWILRKRVIVHESDVSLGLTTRICSHFADTVCVSWKETLEAFPLKKVVLSGIPLRQNILHADRERGLKLTGFTRDLPIVVVCGGSLGAKSLNELVWQSLCDLLPHCQIAHFCGTGKRRENFKRNTVCCNLHASDANQSALSDLSSPDMPLSRPKLTQMIEKRYKQFELLDKEYADILAACDFVVSRSGSNALQEFIALKKPSILIPLGKDASRGDQIENARVMEKDGMSVVIPPDHIEISDFISAILGLVQNEQKRLVMSRNAHLFLECQNFHNILDILFDRECR